MMRDKRMYYTLAFATVLFMGCGTDNKIRKETSSAIATSKMESSEHNTIEIKETWNEEDLQVNNYLTERLKPIRENFKRINSIENWTAVKTKDLQVTTEGGEVKFYYQDDRLEKITARYFGETFQLLSEYYLREGQLSFVFERFCKYTVPFITILQP